jgi:hypothetical protein
VILKFGFDGIKAPIGALTQAQWRANARANRSDRSTYNALAWLQEHGWIYRHRLRLGENRYLAIIDIHRDKFAYFLKKSDVQKEPTCVTVRDDSPLLQEMHSLDPLSTSDPYNKPIYSNATVAKSNDRAKPSKKVAEIQYKKKHYQHPVRYTCYLLLATATDKKSVLTRIDAELAKKTSRVSLDWGWFSSRWLTMTHTEREYFAATDIIPVIRAAIKTKVMPDSEVIPDSKPKPSTRKVEPQPQPDHLTHLSPAEQNELAEIQRFLIQARENAKNV